MTLRFSSRRRCRRAVPVLGSTQDKGTGAAAHRGDTDYGDIMQMQTQSHDEDEVLTAQKQAALSLIFEAWDEAASEGIESDVFVHTALFVVLSELVEAYGETAVAEFAARLPTRIQNGEFSVERVIQ